MLSRNDNSDIAIGKLVIILRNLSSGYAAAGLGLTLQSFISTS